MKTVIRCIKTFLYHILLWLRGFIVGILRLISGIAFLMGLFMIFITKIIDPTDAIPWSIVGLYLGISFVTTVIAHYYDILILYLVPDNEYIIL